MALDKNSICIGKIVGAHGIHGGVRIHVYSDDPECLLRYKNMSDAKGVVFKAKKLRLQKGSVVIVRFDGISTRNQAEELRGVELFISRDQMPILSENEFYINDLIGLKVRNLNGEEIGYVKAVENHGAGDFLTIDPFLKVCVPFTKMAVPEVHIQQKYIVLDENFLQVDESDEE